MTATGRRRDDRRDEEPAVDRSERRTVPVARQAANRHISDALSIFPGAESLPLVPYPPIANDGDGCAQPSHTLEVRSG